MMNEHRDYVTEARDAWMRARPWTAMTILAADGYNALERRGILLSWGVSHDDAIDFASDTYLSIAR